MTAYLPAPTATPPGHARLSVRTAIILLIAAFLVVAVILGVIAVKVRGDATSEPVRAVRAFLEASQQGDPEQALAVAGVYPVPDDESARFLVPAAMRGDWTIEAVEQISEDRLNAQVRATIAGPDGQTAATDFSLSRKRQEWTVNNPFHWVTFTPSPWGYADINGVRVPTDRGDASTEFPLLPGFYQFFPEPPTGFETRYPDLLALPEVGRSTTVAAEDSTLTAAGESLVQEAVNAFIETCAERTEPDPEGCPFGADPVLSPRVPGHDRLAGVTVIDWSVVEYPVLAVVPTRKHLAITDRRRGIIELHASGQDLSAANETPVEFTVSCEMITSQLSAEFTPEGEVTIVPGNRSWDTCVFPLTTDLGE